MKKRAYQLWLASAVSLYLATPSLSQAQITSDGTLSTEVTTSNDRNFTINGGSRVGGNLFHSFREFSVPDERSAFFNNLSDVDNIISRVTGGSISNINGLIRANASANLFLINPKGIILGPNARLEIGGSFLASTANRLNFADGTFFSATDSQTQPLLSINVPMGLQFGETAGEIINQSVATDSSGAPVGLQVQPGKTLALVGSNVFVEGGLLIAPEGRIELGSVAGISQVSIKPIEKGWSLGYESVQNFQDIQLTERTIDGTNIPSSIVSSSSGVDKSSGTIHLRGRQITITGSSSVEANNFGVQPGESIMINASESVEVSDFGALLNGTFGAGKAGDIIIKTPRLIVRDGGTIRAFTRNFGQAGNITVDASKSVEVIRSSSSSTPGIIEAQTFSMDENAGNAGTVKITTGKLSINGGGQIATSTSTSGAGDGGTLTVGASEFVEVSGRSEDGALSSGLFARAGEGATGNAGTLGINTRQLIIKDGATVTVSSLGTGSAGDLEVTADSILLDNAGKLTATSGSGNVGNIRLQNLDLLLLRDESEIATDASRGSGNGGDINIDTNLLVGVENSDITATAIKGQGGNIQINTQGIFGIEPRSKPTSESDITASSDLGVDGVVEINRPEIDPSGGLVTLPTELVDISRLIAQGCLAGGDNVARGASKFVATGRGGLPPTPTEALRSDSALADLGTPIQGDRDRAATTSTNPTNSQPTPIVEAQGWVTGPQGEIILIAQAPSVTPHIPWLPHTSCNGF